MIATETKKETAVYVSPPENGEVTEEDLEDEGDIRWSDIRGKRIASTSIVRPAKNQFFMIVFDKWSNMKVGFAYKLLSKKFEKHGRRISRFVFWFLIGPIFFSFLLATGLQKLKIDNSENIFVTSNGVVGKYRWQLRKWFPMDTSSDFQPGRSIDTYLYATVIVETRDKGSVLRSSVFQEIITLDENIRNFTFSDKGQWKYEDLCAKNNGKCWQNSILLLESKIARIENGTFALKYPINRSSKKNYNVLSLGGIAVNDKNEIIFARALRLIYFLNDADETMESLSKKWEKVFVDGVSALKFEKINVVKDISTSFENSLIDVFKITKVFLPLSMFCMLLYTISVNLSPDFLRSKPWVGIMSSLATGLSVISGFGLLMYCGLKFSSSLTLVPFLILGIGMDDTFIMLYAWKKSEKTKTLPEKMAETFSETGVSITITSLTNIASFAITFMGAIFVYCGKAEEKNLHSLVFVPLKKFSSTGRKSFLKKIFCYVSSETVENRSNCQCISNIVTNFTRMLTKNTTKISVVIFYFVYLGFSIWGITKISYNATLNLNVIGGSYRHYYYELQKQYYYQYQYRLQFIILEKLDYADPLVQQKVEETMQTLESDPLIGGSLMTESWLRSYLRFVSDKRTASLISSYNLTNTKDFLFVLQNYFLRIPRAKRFKSDISFEENNTNVISSRFLLQTNISADENRFYRQLVQLRKKIDQAPFDAIIYHPLFFYFDLVDAIPATATQTMSIVSVTVFLICAILLPNVTSIVCVLFDVLSVGIGVLGFMSFCNIHLGLNSITMFIVVIGFSVDYAAHVACAYVSSRDTDPNLRLIRAISMTGIPIIQGCLTTVLAVIFNIFLPLLESRQSVIILCISCVISLLHGILFVPVIMSLLNSLCQRACEREKRDKDKKVNDILLKPET
ncbi:patched domain-containing protein 3-like isoform X2 [Centruroides sculpturatus]|uniref:patched domain-containing protein 3-like isoform X2 n=1 Tax=Centruroides sculpturatus TaxID=218467 RepID=UPI000C6ECCA1|nr:patched domain-containing protein 3-like isoform X2 [Centruroides sculpturatus]